jgi:hypothetical protein
VPTTPNYALPYPGTSDPPHGPNQIAALASATDTALLGVNNALDARLDVIEAWTYARGEVGRFQRDTPTSTTTTALRAFWMPAPVVAGRAYKVWTNPIAMFSTVAGDDISMDITYTTNGSTPTTASPLLPGGVVQDRMQSLLNGLFLPITTRYAPATSHTLNLALCVRRKSGTGNVSLFADVASGYVMTLVVEDIGPAVSATGTLN